MASLFDKFLPPTLGHGYRWLVASSWVGNVGDGIALAAGPLLVASQTRSAFLVASAAFLQYIPWLVLGLYAGVIADRVDRRLLLVVSETCRAAVIVALCVIILTGVVNIWMVLLSMFLLGIAEVFSSTTTSTLLPMLVDRDKLGLANSRIQASAVVGQNLLGPPLGAFLFSAGRAWPFVTQAILVILAVLLVAKIGTSRGGVGDRSESRVLSDVKEGVSWLWSHPAIRTLALTILSFNITFGAAWSVLVLYALHHLHMGSLGFGLLTTSSALGGLVSTLTYKRMEARWPMATLMRVCLSLEVLMHLSLALTTTGWVAIIIMFVFGMYTFVWSTVSQTVRQRSVPLELQGRVASVYLVCVFGGMVFGLFLGGIIADHWGLVAPFWFACIGSGLTLALVWKELGKIADKSIEPTPA